MYFSTVRVSMKGREKSQEKKRNRKKNLIITGYDCIRIFKGDEKAE